MAGERLDCRDRAPDPHASATGTNDLGGPRDDDLT